MRTTILGLLTAVIGLWVALPALAADPASDAVDGPNVRVKRHADGSKSVFRRSPDQTLVVKKTYSAAGRLTLVTKYKMDENGNPVASEIFDGQKTLLYRVDYGYRKKDGLLAIERMWDARIRRVWENNPKEEMPVQVVHYTDADGKAIRPLVVKYVKGQTFEQVYGSSSSALDPKMFDKPGEASPKKDDKAGGGR